MYKGKYVHELSIDEVKTYYDKLRQKYPLSDEERADFGVCKEQLIAFAYKILDSQISKENTEAVETVELVVRMPKEQYRFIKEEISIDKVMRYPALMDDVCTHIAEGIPLPKGHDNLVDFGKLRSDYWDGNSMEIYEDDIPNIEVVIPSENALNVINNYIKEMIEKEKGQVKFLQSLIGETHDDLELPEKTVEEDIER